MSDYKVQEEALDLIDKHADQLDVSIGKFLQELFNDYWPLRSKTNYMYTLYLVLADVLGTHQVGQAVLDQAVAEGCFKWNTFDRMLDEWDKDPYNTQEKAVYNLWNYGPAGAIDFPDESDLDVSKLDYQISGWENLPCWDSIGSFSIKKIKDIFKSNLDDIYIPLEDKQSILPGSQKIRNGIPLAVESKFSLVDDKIVLDHRTSLGGYRCNPNPGIFVPLSKIADTDTCIHMCSVWLPKNIITKMNWPIWEG